MKRKLTVILSIVLLLPMALTACKTSVPVTEELTNYGDSSTVYMPVVNTGNVGLDSQINTELRSRLEANFNKIKGEDTGITTEGFTAFQSGDLLSIFQEGFFEEAGGAGGESYIYTMHINVRNGTFYELDDLFNPGYEEELTALVSEVLTNQLEEYYLTYSPNIKDTSFDVYGGELIFIFDPQTVAPESLGFVDAAISFSRIEHLFNKEGEFYGVLSASAE